MSEVQTHILQFLSTQRLSVISTADPETSTPESALIAFVELEDLSLYFQTKSHTRKAENLSKNQHVSFVIGLTLAESTTVQYQGEATRVTDAGEIERAKQLFRAKDSPAVPHLDHPDAVLFKVTPTWVRFSDYSQGKPLIEELQFQSV